MTQKHYYKLFKKCNYEKNNIYVIVPHNNFLL